jgi:hypothetical protein
MDDEEGLEKELLWGRKRDRRVEVLRVCLGKREEEFWGGIRGTYIVLGRRRVIAVTALRIGNDALVLKKGFTGE